MLCQCHRPDAHQKPFSLVLKDVLSRDVSGQVTSAGNFVGQIDFKGVAFWNCSS
jgi:hypothetical protein